MMNIEGMVIEVRGLPDIPDSSRDSTIDKLTINFLRRSNSGGDVLTVIYPTSTKGQAYVVFESAEVEGVLEHTHILEIQGLFYRLDIKRVHRHQLDMPAEANLDVSMFSNQREIHNFLYRHGFKVSVISPGLLHLEGSFLNLKLIRPKLMQFLPENVYPQRRISSPYTNGHSYETASKLDPNELVHISTSSHINSLRAGAKSPPTGILPKYESPDREPLSQTASPLAGNSIMGGSHRVYGDSSTSSLRWISSSFGQTEVSIHVEPDVYNYAISFKKDFLEQIKELYNVKIEHESNSDVATVKVVGEAHKDAAKELSNFMERIRSHLRTQEIDLETLDDNQKRQITYNFYKNQDKYKYYKVLVRQEDNILKIVGSSSNSYEVMQSLRRHGVDISVSSQLGKLRRSNSLPRQTTRTEIDALNSRHNHDSVHQETAVSSSLSSHYQRGSQSERPLGHEVNTPESSRLERHTRVRRSSSLTRQTTRAVMEDLNQRQTSNIVSQAAAISSSSPSHSQRDSQSRQELQQERGRQSSKTNGERSRRSSSESRVKHQNRIDSPPQTNDQQDLSPSSGAKTSKKKQFPKIKSSFLPDDFKSALYKIKKKS